MRRLAIQSCLPWLGESRLPNAMSRGRCDSIPERCVRRRSRVDGRACYFVCCLAPGSPPCNANPVGPADAACVSRDLAWLRAVGLLASPCWCPSSGRRVSCARVVRSAVHWASARCLAMRALDRPPSSRSCDPDTFASHCFAACSLRGAAASWWGAVLVFYLVASERCVACLSVVGLCHCACGRSVALLLMAGSPAR